MPVSARTGLAVIASTKLRRQGNNRLILVSRALRNTSEARNDFLRNDGNRRLLVALARRSTMPHFASLFAASMLLFASDRPGRYLGTS